MDAKRATYDEAISPAAGDLDGFSLPGWIYRDAEFLEVEKERVFAPSWQIVCHLNDIPRPGDYHTLDFLGEPLVAVRGRDANVKAFFNVCRHRARAAPRRRLRALPGTHRVPVPCLDVRSRRTAHRRSAPQGIRRLFLSSAMA